MLFRSARAPRDELRLSQFMSDSICVDVFTYSTRKAGGGYVDPEAGIILPKSQVRSFIRALQAMLDGDLGFTKAEHEAMNDFKAADHGGY
mgnify:FL=1